jgi:zinc protease
VRNEWEASENSPLGVLLRRTLSMAYLWHGYGRPTIGARSDIENVPIARLRTFYQRYYQPDNAILVISGSFDPDRTLGWVEEYFGAMPAPDRSGELAIWDTYTREPAQDGERMVTVRRVGDVQYVMAAYHVPAGAHEDFPAVDLLAHVLGNAPSGRLYQALVETELAARVGTNLYRLREPGALLVFAEVRQDPSLDDVRAELIRSLDALADTPPTAEEVERARAVQLRNMQLTLNSSERVGLDLTEWAASGDWRLIFIHRDRLRETTVDDVARVARTYLVPSNRTVGLFIPDTRPLRAEIPPAPDVAALVADYRGEEGAVVGEAFAPTPENIEARTIRFELDNGFRVALLPKQTRGGTVLIRFSQRIGNEDELMGRSAHGSLAGSMLMRGTRQRSRQELTDRLAQLQTQMFVGGGAIMITGSAETDRENLRAVLDLLREVLREPAFDTRELETLKREQLAALENQRSEPNALGARAFARHMNPRPPGHPQHVQTFDEAIASVESTTLQDVRAFYDDFYGFGDGGTFTVVGDFDPDEVAAFVRDTFADWPRRRSYVRVPNPFSEIAPTAIEIETPDKTNAFLQAGSVFRMQDDHADFPALVLGGYMMGGGFLNSRLAVRIRQQEGISYGISAGINVPPIDDRAAFTTSAIYAPENADRLVAALREEVLRALEHGFTAEEVDAAKRGWMQQREVVRATDQQLVNMLDNNLFLGRDLFHEQALEERVMALTPDQIHAAMRRHIDADAITIVRAGDFASVVSASRD